VVVLELPRGSVERGGKLAPKAASLGPEGLAEEDDEPEADEGKEGSSAEKDKATALFGEEYKATSHRCHPSKKAGRIGYVAV
jgi:hypothetical protein